MKHPAKNMILIYVGNGLGNQLFQYAYGAVISAETKRKDIKYDLSYLPASIEGRKTYQINNIFKNNFPIASYYDIWKLTGKFPWIYRLLLNNSNCSLDKCPAKADCNYIYEPEKRYKITPQVVGKLKKIDYCKYKNCYVYGYWEDMSYFQGHEEKIRRLFQFKHKLTKKERQRYHNIFNKNSVAVHIRRGDYLRQKNNADFCICDDRYYNKAFQLIEERIKNPFYVFFSDDPDYVRKKYKHLKHKLIVENNKDYIDLQLMSLCSNFIIANSTFSFWGAFLNRSKQKVVIAPQVHYLYRERKWLRIPFPSENSWITINNA